SPGEVEMTFSTSEVAVCCSSASASCLRASASSRACSSGCLCKSAEDGGRWLVSRPLVLRRWALPPLPTVVARRFMKVALWLPTMYFLLYHHNVIMNPIARFWHKAVQCGCPLMTHSGDRAGHLSSRNTSH